VLKRSILVRLYNECCTPIHSKLTHQRNKEVVKRVALPLVPIVRILGPLTQGGYKGLVVDPWTQGESKVDPSSNNLYLQRNDHSMHSQIPPHQSIYRQMDLVVGPWTQGGNKGGVVGPWTQGGSKSRSFRQCSLIATQWSFHALTKTTLLEHFKTGGVGSRSMDPGWVQGFGGRSMDPGWVHGLVVCPWTQGLRNNFLNRIYTFQNK